MPYYLYNENSYIDKTTSYIEMAPRVAWPTLKQSHVRLPQRQLVNDMIPKNIELKVNYYVTFRHQQPHWVSNLDW